MKNAFEHLNVIEIASVLAGPSVGMFFAEMNAKVTKIENKKTGGDVTRSWKLASEGENENVSAYYAAVNWNKKSIFMDFTIQEEMEALKNLIREADVLIVNFKEGDAKKFGLTYEELKIINPQLIYGEINGFGEGNERVAYDLILQAETGFMSMNGTPNSGPVKMPVALIDILAGQQLRSGILTALYERDALHKGGAKVAVSLFDAAIAALANQATNWLMNHHIPERIGSTHPNIAPYGELFTTKDNIIITFAIGSNKQFKNLCSTLDKKELVNHPNFEDNQNRVENRLSLSSYLQEAVGQFQAEELVNELVELKVPVARIKNLKEVFDSAAAQELILEEKIGDLLTKRVKTSIFKINR